MSKKMSAQEVVDLLRSVGVEFDDLGMEGNNRVLIIFLEDEVTDVEVKESGSDNAQPETN